MTKNIKEIGKELLGKSLNSFHRKTGLTQLEKNNEMQDGILNGILSQVDDVYIEKTEQSNVIHLDGSGDGVVVLDGIEGNTMVNVIDCSNISNVMGGTWTFVDGVLEVNFTNIRDAVWKDEITLKPNTTYTISYDLETMITDGSTDELSYVGYTVYEKVNSEKWWSSEGYYAHDKMQITADKLGVVCNKKVLQTFTTKGESSIAICGTYYNSGASGYTKFKKLMLLEGDYTNKEINYFEGLQSSFEEKLNDEGKYEIEILSHKGRPNELKKSYEEYTNINPPRNEYIGINITNIAKKYLGKRVVVSGYIKPIGVKGQILIYSLGCYHVGFSSYEQFDNMEYKYFVREGRFSYNPNDPNGEVCTLSFYGVYDSGVVPCVKDIKIEILDEDDTILATEWCPHYEDDESYWLSHKNSNKIKLLLNEPLRSVSNGVKDKLCIKNKKLVIERNALQLLINGTEDFHLSKDNSYNSDYHWFAFRLPSECKIVDNAGISKVLISDKFNVLSNTSTDFSKDEEFITLVTGNKSLYFNVKKANYPALQDFKNYLSNNNVNIVSEITEPIYEEVLNEYGEPILLEGYENGTIYIDSTIVPTTSVRYTPKMESFKTIREVKDNNIMLTTDINDAIIPYMLEVDMMILEKEVAIMSHKNIRKIGEKDMTNMQKRTYDMLARLIKGKTLNEQECKTRVTVYLNAGKITDEQAKELNFLIDEIYA